MHIRAGKSSFRGRIVMVDCSPLVVEFSRVTSPEYASIDARVPLGWGFVPFVTVADQKVAAEEGARESAVAVSKNPRPFSPCFIHLLKFMVIKCGGLLALLVLLVPVRAQEGDFSSQVNLVPVPTLVRDAKGNAISGLVANDFVIEDEGVEQVVHLDDAAEAEPVSLIVVMQCGRRANREFERMAGLASMLDPVLSDPDNEAALLFVDSKLDLAQDFTHDADKIEGRLKKIPSGDGAGAIVDAIAYSASLLGRLDAGPHQVLLLVCEPRDHGSEF